MAGASRRTTTRRGHAERASLAERRASSWPITMSAAQTRTRTRPARIVAAPTAGAASARPIMARRRRPAPSAVSIRRRSRPSLSRPAASARASSPGATSPAPRSASTCHPGAAYRTPTPKPASSGRPPKPVMGSIASISSASGVGRRYTRRSCGTSRPCEPITSLMWPNISRSRSPRSSNTAGDTAAWPGSGQCATPGGRGASGCRGHIETTITGRSFSSVNPWNETSAVAWDRDGALCG